jgi:hypothetical protein
LGIDIIARVLIFKTHQSTVYFELALIQHPLQHVRAKVGFAQWSRQQQQAGRREAGTYRFEPAGGSGHDEYTSPAVFQII